jgi:nucleotide-binding universal stress UspA family protein
MFRTIVAGCNGRERGRGYAAQRRDLEQNLRAVRDELAPEAVIRIRADMSPAHALRHVARYEGADLLVVGSRHRRRLQHMAESDHAMQVLHGARCAVAIAPDPLAPRPELRRIGVGIDATPESVAALEMACELARRTGARLRLVAVADDALSGWVGYVAMPLDEDTLQDIVEQRETAARALVDERLALCEGADAEVVVVGSPAGELILASEDLDLLVLGSRRWGPVKRLALGSTSEQVIRHTACPVLVPPRGAESEHDERDTAVDQVAVE